MSPTSQQGYEFEDRRFASYANLLGLAICDSKTICLASRTHFRSAFGLSSAICLLTQPTLEIGGDSDVVTFKISPSNQHAAIIQGEASSQGGISFRVGKGTVVEAFTSRNNSFFQLCEAVFGSHFTESVPSVRLDAQVMEVKYWKSPVAHTCGVSALLDLRRGNTALGGS
jgi:hypothetical protein